MSNKRVAINGFGRIGRLTLRAFLEVRARRSRFRRHQRSRLGRDERPSAGVRQRAWPVPGGIDVADKHLKTNGQDVAVLSEATPEKLPWRDLGIDIVMECTGRFTDRDGAAKHLTAGAKRVLVSAPCSGADLTVVFGVNHDKLTQEHHVVSNASCTTNCLAPVAQVLNEAIGIKHGYMTTVHAYTGDQRTVDTLHKDPYRARASAINLIPSSTGAAKAVGLVLPELKGKLDGASIRVPVPNVSLIDLTFQAARPTTVDEINQAIVRRPRAHSRVFSACKCEAAGLDRFQPRSVELDLRPDLHPCGRRHVLPRGRLVRQRMGLLQSHVRHGGRHGAADMNKSSGALDKGAAGGIDLSRIRTIDGVDVEGKRVLVRVDFNVPIEGGAVADATRITRVSPTIAKLAGKGAKVVVLSHLGRPKGAISADSSLRPVAKKMQEAMPGTVVRFIGDCMGEEVRRGLATLRPGDVAALKNVRFYPGEEKNDPRFAESRRAWRPLCQRCVLIGSSGACLDRGHRRSVALLRGPADDGRDQRARPSPRNARPAGYGHCRRRQGLDQDRGPDQSCDAHGPARGRRRHGHHVPAGARQGGREVVMRARFRADGQGHHGAGRAVGLRDRVAGRRGGGDEARGKCRSPGFVRPTRCPPTP